jgi:hypothetical protein
MVMKHDSTVGVGLRLRSAIWGEVCISKVAVEILRPVESRHEEKSECTHC